MVEENYISPENLNKPLVHTQIECMSVHESGEWMATCERRADGSTTPDVKLKLWSFDKSTKKFTLNTIVKYPHSYERVTRLKFKPSSSNNNNMNTTSDKDDNDVYLYSSGDDTCIKSWALSSSSSSKADASSSALVWTYNSSNGYRDLNPVDMDFMRLNSDLQLVNK